MNLDRGNRYCRCGQKIETTAGSSPNRAEYDGEGRCIYAVCSHGVVVIDKRFEEVNHEHIR